MTEISKNIFYGKELCEHHLRHESKINESTSRYNNKNDLPAIKPKGGLLGPSDFWGEYSTQQEALDVANERSLSSLHTFVFQNDQGYRKFIVAHPEIYWFYDERKSPDQRCSYEVIPDGSPCHLYFDLEFPIDLNPLKNGSNMTKTLIDIFSLYISENWGFPCKRSDVLSLDSSTETKFSRHLIFRLKNAMFKNNKHVGRFVKDTCADIRKTLLILTDANNSSSSSSFSNNKMKILNQFKKKDLEELFIDTKNGRKLFIDDCVYTKNRHFRIYKSTKWGKNSHLIRSQDCEYISKENSKFKQYDDEELRTFLDSLISYIPWGSNRNLVLLEYQENGTIDAIKYSKESLSQRTSQYSSSEKIKQSLYPDIDKFILDIAFPGKIREVKYPDNRTLIYSIADYRYCANIGRQHKSNGIYWVVDLSKKIAFQKCFDVDCKGFKSLPERLPDEISFQLDEENDVLLASVPEPQEDTIVNALEDDSLDAELTKIDINPFLN